MKKLSYSSRKPEAQVPSKLKDIPSVPRSEEGLDASSPGSGVGRGYSLPGEPSQAYDEDYENEFLSPPKLRRVKDVDSKKLLDLFVMLGDQLDEEGDYALASFADFMIKKIAVQVELDYSILFKELLIKIVESDILDKNKLIISLVALFNRVVILNANKTDINNAKLEGYQAAVARAKEYVE